MKTCSVCENKHYAKGYCKRHYMRNLKGLPLHTEKKTNIGNCASCGKEVKIHSKGKCRKCYQNEWYRKTNNAKPKIPRSNWSRDDLEYISKFCEIDSAQFLAAGLGKPVEQVEEKLKYLRRTGQLEYYRKSYERKLL